MQKKIPNSVCSSCLTGDFLLVLLGFVQIHSGGVPVQRVDRIRVCKQLREERLEDVGQIWNGKKYHNFIKRWIFSRK